MIHVLINKFRLGLKSDYEMFHLMKILSGNTENSINLSKQDLTKNLVTKVEPFIICNPHFNNNSISIAI